MCVKMLRTFRRGQVQETGNSDSIKKHEKENKSCETLCLRTRLSLAKKVAEVPV